MQYIQETEFVGLKGLPFVIKKPSEGVEPHNATTGEMMGLVLLTYDTNHDYFAFVKKLVLSAKEIARFNIIDLTMDGEPDVEAGTGKGATRWWAFEDQDYTLLKKLLEWCGPEAPWWRQSIALEEMMGAATTEKPGAKES